MSGEKRQMPRSLQFLGALLFIGLYVPVNTIKFLQGVSLAKTLMKLSSIHIEILVVSWPVCSLNL